MMLEGIKDCKAVSILNRLLFIVKHYFQKGCKVILALNRVFFTFKYYFQGIFEKSTDM